MIYFDNSSTTLTKPPEVAEAMVYALKNFGNAGRSFYDAAWIANREIYNTRAEIAKLIGHDDPLQVAFTSSATESLNLVIGGLINKNDSVATTVNEHNSVLRPLYLSGCELTFDLTPDTKFLVCTHGSNVTGEIVDAQRLYNACKARGITMILDISQTFGTVPVSVDMADIFCFTGHKGLLGPQGTGGIIVNGAFDFKMTKTGGSGVNTFDTFQTTEMPDIFEVGTINSHSIYGLQKGVQFINEIGVEKIHEKELHLLKMFHEGVKNYATIYGDMTVSHRLPIVSLNIKGLTSSELAERLWQDYAIATRAGSHCAPLLHKHYKTDGMVRFSFSYFNTENEIQKGIDAIKHISGGCHGKQ
ncbi:MAG: aminotransferase class V-fold PLP-dependent enzyme [Defluviitaleaceae bacterium]|nr:aminotransferase class V-fold PLP-dependent enzyme [Defluviitaleaceae bacterium]